jgi:hypothetical protein
MADIGDLIAYLKLNTEGFAHDLGVSEKQLDHFVDHVKEASMELAAAMGVAIGIEKTVEAIHEAIESTAKLSHESEKLGIGVEQFQALARGAELNHVSIEQLAGAMEKLQKNTIDAAMGSKKLTPEFEKLGLNAKEMLNMNAAEKFMAVGDAMKRMGDAADHTHAEFVLLGKGGVGVHNMLMEGSEGFEKWAAFLKDMGININELDAQKMVQADQAIKDLTAIISGNFRNAVVEIAPFIKGVVVIIETLIPVVRQAIPGFVALAESLIPGVTILETLFGYFKDGINAIASFGQGQSKAAENADSMALEQAKLNEFMAEQNESEKEAAKLFEETRTPLEKLVDKYEEAEALFQQGAIDEDTYMRVFEKMAEEAAKPITKLQEEGDKLASSLRTPIEKAEDEFERAQDLFNGGFIDEDTLTKSFVKLGEELDKLKDKELKEVNKEWEEMAKRAEKVWEDTRTPLEKYKDALADLYDEYENGFLDEDALGRGIEKATEEMNKADAKGAGKGGNGPIERGSKDDLQLIVNAIDSRKDDPAKQTAKHTATIAAHTAQQTAALAGIQKSLEGIKTWDIANG